MGEPERGGEYLEHALAACRAEGDSIFTALALCDDAACLASARNVGAR